MSHETPCTLENQRWIGVGKKNELIHSFLTLFVFSLFLGRVCGGVIADHSNYVAATSPQGPIIVSIAVNKRGIIRILIRTTQVWILFCCLCLPLLFISSALLLRLAWALINGALFDTFVWHLFSLKAIEKEHTPSSLPLFSDVNLKTPCFGPQFFSYFWQGSERIEQSISSLSIPWYRRAFGVSHLTLLSLACPALPIDTLELCQNPGLPPELARMEERQIIRCYKFGVYHLLPGQTTEYQGLSNTQGKKFFLSFFLSFFFFHSISYSFPWDFLNCQCSTTETQQRSTKWREEGSPILSTCLWKDKELNFFFVVVFVAPC